MSMKCKEKKLPLNEALHIFFNVKTCLIFCFLFNNSFVKENHHILTFFSSERSIYHRLSKSNIYPEILITKENNVNIS